MSDSKRRILLGIILGIPALIALLGSAGLFVSAFEADDDSLVQISVAVGLLGFAILLAAIARYSRRMVDWLICSIAASVAAIAFAVLPMLAAWDHNPQGEFHND